MTDLVHLAHLEVVENLDSTQPELLSVFLAEEAESATRYAAITHPNVSASAIKAIIESGGSFSQLALAMTVNTEILRHYARSAHIVFRAIVAFNPAASVHSLIDLAVDLNAIVRLNVALNPGLPAQLRVSLVRHDVDDWVRDAAWWGMSTVKGRMALDGSRFALAPITVDGRVTDDHEEGRVLYMFPGGGSKVVGLRVA
jgi:hypothetical protein